MEKEEPLKNSVVKFYEEKLETETGKLIPICYHPGGTKTTDMVIKEAGIGKDAIILDVASGPGDTAIHLATSLEVRVVGTDLSQKMVEHAKSLVKGIEVDQQVKFVIADAEKLPFKDNSFDAALSECSLCLIPNILKALSEMKRVVKPGTKVVVSDVILLENLPANLNNFLSYAGCIAGAKTLEGYVKEFKKAGFIKVRTMNLSHFVNKQIRQFLESRKINPEEVINAGKSLLSKLADNRNMKDFQLISFYLWLAGKIGYGMLSGVKPGS